MFGKLLLVILIAALTAVALLILRQQRIETAHEMSVVHQQMLEHERVLWELQCEIARLCRPEEVRRLMQSLQEQWTTIPDPTCAEPAEPNTLTLGATALGGAGAADDEFGG